MCTRRVSSKQVSHCSVLVITQMRPRHVRINGSLRPWWLWSWVRVWARASCIQSWHLREWQAAVHVPVDLHTCTVIHEIRTWHRMRVCDNPIVDPVRCARAWYNARRACWSVVHGHGCATYTQQPWESADTREHFCTWLLNFFPAQFYFVVFRSFNRWPVYFVSCISPVPRSIRDGVQAPHDAGMIFLKKKMC